MAKGSAVGPRQVLATLLTGALLCTTVSLRGAERAVMLGDVSAPGEHAKLEQPFRKIVASELGRLRLPSNGKRAYVLSASLVQMKTRRGAEVTCAVSATIREESGGSLKAVLRGRASVSQEGSVRQLQTEAMQAAVRSTLSGLGNVLSKVE